MKYIFVILLMVFSFRSFGQKRESYQLLKIDTTELEYNFYIFRQMDSKVVVCVYKDKGLEEGCWSPIKIGNFYKLKLIPTEYLIDKKIHLPQHLVFIVDKQDSVIYRTDWPLYTVENIIGFFIKL